MTLETFTDSVDGFYDLSSSEQIRYFGYYLLLICKQDGFKPIEIKKQFENLHITPYSNIPKYLNDKSKGKASTKLFIKKKDKFYLIKNIKEGIDESLNISKVKISKDLSSLTTRISNPEQNAFFNETLKCFGVGAYRATIAMTWNLSVDHLYGYILSNKLAEFNVVLSKNTDKRIKITSVATKDDFSEIPENKLIEFMRSAKIISNDVRKILDVSLGVRNSAAHPSNIEFKESKTISLVEDLIENVLLKYK